jgi:hypothetical protein
MRDFISRNSISTLTLILSLILGIYLRKKNKLLRWGYFKLQKMLTIKIFALGMLFGYFIYNLDLSLKSRKKREIVFRIIP